LAAIGGARRAGLAALRWDDVDGTELTIEVVKRGNRKAELCDATT